MSLWHHFLHIKWDLFDEICMKSPIQFYNIKQGNIYLRKKGNAVVLNIHDDGRIVVQLFFKIPQFPVLIFVCTYLIKDYSQFKSLDDIVYSWKSKITYIFLNELIGRFRFWEQFAVFPRGCSSTQSTSILYSIMP